MITRTGFRTILITAAMLSGAWVQAQVGIGTKTPLAGTVFHVDAKGNTSGATNTNDDVVIDAQGRVGVGLTTPTAHFHIDKGTVSSIIRIEDTSERMLPEGMYLNSDDDGNGSWIPAIALYGKVYRMNSPSGTVITYTPGQDTPVRFNLIRNDAGSTIANTDGGYVRVDADGNYVFTLRWWGSVRNAMTNNFGVFTAYLRLYKVVGGAISGVPLDEMVIAVPNAQFSSGVRWSSFATSLFAEGLKKNDLVAITINPTNGANYPWDLGFGLAADQFSNIIYYPSMMFYNI